MKTEAEILLKYISMVESDQIQSKYLVTLHLNDQLLYWKDIYYEIEKNGVVDAFINGRWNYEPGTIILIKVFSLPLSTPSMQYKLTFLQSGIQIGIEE